MRLDKQRDTLLTGRGTSGPRFVDGYLAYLLFLTVLVHLAAALFHGWVRRDEVLDSMLRGKS